MTRGMSLLEPIGPWASNRPPREVRLRACVRRCRARADCCHARVSVGRAHVKPSHARAGRCRARVKPSRERVKRCRARVKSNSARPMGPSGHLNRVFEGVKAGYSPIQGISGPDSDVPGAIARGPCPSSSSFISLPSHSPRAAMRGPAHDSARRPAPAVCRSGRVWATWEGIRRLTRCFR